MLRVYHIPRFVNVLSANYLNILPTPLVLFHKNLWCTQPSKSWTGLNLYLQEWASSDYLHWKIIIVIKWVSMLNGWSATCQKNETAQNYQTKRFLHIPSWKSIYFVIAILGLVYSRSVDMTAPPELERLALAQHPEKAGLVQGFTGGRLLVHCHSAHLIYVRVQGFAVSQKIHYATSLIFISMASVTVVQSDAIR